jgi:hypothetical protein
MPKVEMYIVESRAEALANQAYLRSPRQWRTQSLDWADRGFDEAVWLAGQLQLGESGLPRPDIRRRPEMAARPHLQEIALPLPRMCELSARMRFTSPLDNPETPTNSLDGLINTSITM